MSAYTPDETQIVAGYSHVAYMESQGMRSEADAAREARRGIAKIKADAWDEGLDAGRDRWMDSREFGDPPINPHRIERGDA